MSFGVLELGEVSELWNIRVKLGELLSVENLGFGDMNFEILELGEVSFGILQVGEVSFGM